MRLERVVTCVRIGDAGRRAAILDGAGSGVYPGRWNVSGLPVIYCSRHYGTAMLEALAHGGGHLPRGRQAVTVSVPAGVSYEVLDAAMLPGWDERSCGTARAFGAVWRREFRSAILLVPSLVAQDDRNVVINPEHAEFARIGVSRPRAVWWDGGIYGSATSGA